MNLRELAKSEWKLLDSLNEKTDRQKVVYEALSHIGYLEQENNDNMFGHYFDFNNVAWCGFYVHYCCWVGAAIELPSTNKGKRGAVYVPKLYAMLKELDCLTDNPQMGDIVIYNFPGGVNGDHVGLFHKWKDQNYFYSPEGNTSQKGHQSNGGACEYQLRSKSMVLGYGCIEKIKALKLKPQ